ncbi:hypothetical protein HJG60_010191 [Phyllostomus discolor]|uniref:Uncharacterized protein n=1 Tax=Phyllostomus discolor TaxID=89673 RepID=A0A834EG89_9CHIR|nr:hypothetical protein HJG60_010191 [Phyllostomus discolor]
MCVGQRGEKQAVTLSTTLESLFSTRPLYLVSNISPGKRKHFSGQSLGNILSSSLWFTRRLLGHPAGATRSARGLRALHGMRWGGEGDKPTPTRPDCAWCQCEHVRRTSLWGTPTLLKESPQNKRLCCEFAMGVPVLGAFFITATS